MGMGTTQELSQRLEERSFQSDYEWMLFEESLPDAQWEYGKDPEHGWPYPL